MIYPRRRARALLLAAAAVASASAGLGCKSARSGALAERPLWQRHPSWVLDVVERRQLTAPSNVTGEDYERGRAAIDARGRRVFVGSSDRGLYALRAGDLSTLWRFQTAGPVQSEPLYDPLEDVVYFGSNDGALYKVRAFDGDLVWRFASNAEVGRAPLLVGNDVLFVNANDTLVAADASTGKVRWSQHRTPAYGMEISGHAGVAAGGGLAYTAFSDGRVAAFDLVDGKERWAVDLAAEAEHSGGDVPRYLDSDATPIHARLEGGPVVFAASYAGGVHALDAETGARLWLNERARGTTDLLLWEQPAHPARDGGPASPARRVLVASSGTTGLWALDVNDGHELWRKPLPEGGISMPVSVVGALLVSTSRYGLFLLSPIDGSVIDGLETGGGFSATPVALGRRAFVVSNQGVMFSLHVDAPTVRGR